MEEEYRFQGEYYEPPARIKIPKLNIILFFATVCTTWLVYSLMSGSVFQGFMYSVTIIVILLSHELGHYFACRAYGVPATVPFFLPVPIPPFGTFGAVIKMKGVIPNRKALFDIGAGGPIAGLIFTIPAIIVGLYLSKIVGGPMPEGSMMLGESLLFKFLSWLIVGKLPEGKDIMLHPIAFAGWAGLFVTALNLLPIGQLDGGHIIYSLFGKLSKTITNIALIGLAAITIFVNQAWALFLVLVFLIARKHPPTLNDEHPIDTRRIVIGLIMIFIFIVSFTPKPLYISKENNLPKKEKKVNLPGLTSGAYSTSVFDWSNIVPLTPGVLSGRFQAARRRRGGWLHAALPL